MTPTLTPLGGQVSESVWQLALKNRSHSACMLEGFLDVQVQDDNHRNILVARAGAPADQRLIVRPGMTAYTKFHFPYEDPATGEQCQPSAAWLRVGLPDDKGFLDIPIPQPPPGPGNATITFSPCGVVITDAIRAEPVG
jgi:hypothetical protein